MVHAQECPLSGHAMRHVFSEQVLGKHTVAYFQCAACGLLTTEKPYWLDAAYQHAIALCDTGVLTRCIHNRCRVEPILARLFGCQGRFLDLGGGYGVLTRLLRDIGIDCYHVDKYCQNLFAKPFEPGPDFHAQALFAFEVLEHLERPLEFIRDAFRAYACQTLIFSTSAYEGPPPDRDWPYYAFSSGQHITFYQTGTLQTLAQKLGCRYLALGKDLHLVTNRPLSRGTRFLLGNRRACRCYGRYVRASRGDVSLTWDDHLRLR